MTPRLNVSRGEFLLVQPLDTQWIDQQGQPLPQPPDVKRPAHVVVDLMEETHVQLDVPSMMPGDRKGFVEFHLQAKLPDVVTRALWPNGSLNSPLPKAFTLNALGVSSDRLNALLDQMAVEGRPLVGAWTLSYLLAQWANRRKDLPKSGGVFLCLSLKHGMRVVLLQNQVPVFSRLLLATDADAIGEDLLQTLRYLVDSRALVRDQPPSFVLLDSAPGLPTALFSRGLSVLPVSEQFKQGVLGQVLALAKGASPGQIAGVFHRRLRLASQLKLLIVGLSALAGVGLAMTAYGEVQKTLDQLLLANQWSQQTNALTQRTQQVRQKIAESGADVGLMRLTHEVRRTELPDPIHAESLLWQLGQLLQTQPDANLVNVAFAVSASPCSSASAPSNSPAPRGAAASSLAPKLRNQIEWKFQLSPAGGLSPRARQDLMVNMSRSVASWSEWTVVNDPVRPAGTVALSSTQAGGANVWNWCLRSNVPTAEAGKATGPSSASVASTSGNAR